MENKITYLKTYQLVPHPKNPRLDVGDVTELAESIKANGIMQNLTVVPNEEEPGTYRVIIGHRRLAAAKLAGLEEVPCAIKDLTEKEQQSIMLTENMQRTDLTVYEQAQGIQMCLDLGMTENDVCDKTGFSKSTVHRRTRLLKYDKGKVSDALDQGATLQDFADLESIKNEEKREELIGLIGTDKFQKELTRAQTNQKRSNLLDQLEQRLIDAGYEKKSKVEINEINQSNTTEARFDTFFSWNEVEIEEYMPNPELKMVFTREENNSNDYAPITLYLLKPCEDESDEDAKRKLNELKKDIVKQRVETIEQRMINLQYIRMEQFNICFLKKTNNWMINREKQKNLIKWLLFVKAQPYGGFALDEELVSFFCKKYGYINTIDEAIDMKHTYLTLAIITYLSLEIGSQSRNRHTIKGYGDKANVYEDFREKNYKYLYQFLNEMIDYEMDEDEKALIFGTDPLYEKVTDEEAQKLLDAE